MANHFDLEEQEQIEQLKHFWNTWGTLITGVLVVVFAGFAGWNGYQYWQKRQAAEAAALMNAVDMALAAKDAARAGQPFAELKDKYAGTVQAAQAGLLMAKAAVNEDRLDDAKAALGWVADKGDEGYKAIARLRLSAVLEQQKQYDEALKALSGSMPDSFKGVVADRRGDIYAAQGKQAEAIAEYKAAHSAMEKGIEYSRLIEFKLNALGAEPTVVAQAKANSSETQP
ncbi:YfgM family protein [Delftia sp. PS-11]|uniref:YfgM family protein n=1 Tax=Delftia sp. PS-11 TaxID=2767222 RepID=UPI00245598A9|nr:tetratricopeptide repeat protein [Delftia sp. PS-11]KAJ8745058.1 tetratricopeptide repeat protein [Delftia sp. PS-11]